VSKVLVDTAAWINYFAGKKNSGMIDDFIQENVICINDLILAELVPSIRLNKAFELVFMLQAIEKIPLAIDWDELIEMQMVNSKNGINKVGLPDLIIVQNVMQNDLELWSPDRHFKLMSPLFKFKLHSVP
jgi:predicted nucleic acid-binding protein